MTETTLPRSTTGPRTGDGDPPPSPAADKAVLASRVRSRGILYQAEHTLRGMRAYAVVILTSSIAQPIMYILAMGLGLGVLVGDRADLTAYGAESYLMYIGPAILASTMAMSAGIEFTFPVMEKFKWRRIYYGAQASPLTPTQIASGHILAVCARFGVHGLVFTGVLVAVGATTSPWAWLQVFTAALGSLALGLPIMAYIASLRDEKGHAALIQRFIIMPLFLFSGTFYPLTNLPGALQLIGWVSPIWHANELGRMLAFGQPMSAGMATVHLGYLLVLAGAAWFWVRRIYIRRLGLAEWRGRTPGEKSRLKREARLEAKDLAAGPPAPGTPPVKVRSGLAGNYYAGNIRAVFSRGMSAIRNNRGVIFLSGFLEPVLFLTSFGLGISPMISGIEAADGGEMSYAAFIAPALLAVSAMNGAVFDSTWNVFFKLKITKLYQSMMATSLGPLDVAVGEILLALFRGGIYALGFLTVLVAADLVSPLSALVMLVAALFIAFGFAAVGMAVTSFMSRFQQMDWMMMVMMPMFLFSATLFPIDVYPSGVQWMIQALPLWHAVELMRDIAAFSFSALTLVHIGYYLVMIAVGMTVATLRMRRLFLR
ncbi:ABC transporter permease [Nesterenkonia sp. HG001]|uniref:ABC transporter permease n=1 Tax=Nesterenkonia sp. HG001 TaxID=2983207 RepID=UPI002AC4C5D2|nr:ABC transporter permease [Nesterenkonia sp. HG001]MDZ5076845.1 ABC transporter permease [Nesterenkonia sp. HG001]